MTRVGSQLHKKINYKYGLRTHAALGPRVSTPGLNIFVKYSYAPACLP